MDMKIKNLMETQELGVLTCFSLIFLEKVLLSSL